MGAPSPQADSRSVVPALHTGTRDALTHVEIIGETRAGPDFAISRDDYAVPYMEMYINPTRQDAYEKMRPHYLALTLAGEGLLTYGGKQTAVGAGDVLWLDLNQAHVLRPAAGCGLWHILWVYYTGLSVPRYYRAFAGACENVVRLLPSSAVPDQLHRLMHLYDDGAAHAARDLRAEALLVSVMMELIDLAMGAGAARPVPDTVLQARDYIARHYAQNITLDQLSARCNVDKYHLHKLFKQHMGMTPNAFALQTRIRHAKALLYGTSLPISMIAEDVGMENASYFIRQFKAVEGITPAKYRALLYPAAPPPPQETEG